jgi:hypothetical protein
MAMGITRLATVKLKTTAEHDAERIFGPNREENRIKFHDEELQSVIVLFIKYY